MKIGMLDILSKINPLYPIYFHILFSGIAKNIHDEFSNFIFGHLEKNGFQKTRAGKDTKRVTEVSYKRSTFKSAFKFYHNEHILLI